MQATKDSFYVTLRDRLVQAYPTRTMTEDGITRPAIVVAENDKPSVTVKQHDTFYLEWDEARPVQPATSKLMALTCAISYASAGSEENGGLDRGRAITELETELVAICSPSVVQKKDWTGALPVDLGSTIFWNALITKPVASTRKCRAREASVTVYFFPEVSQS